MTAVDPVHPDADVTAAARMLAQWDARPELAEGWRDILDRNWRETRPGGPCCDMHNQHCESPGDLCCWRCTEASHDTFPIRHADGTACVMDQPTEAI